MDISVCICKMQFVCCLQAIKAPPLLRSNGESRTAAQPGAVGMLIKRFDGDPAVVYCVCSHIWLCLSVSMCACVHVNVHAYLCLRLYTRYCVHVFDP